MIGYAFCGSFCTIGRSLQIFEKLHLAGNDLFPICSENVYATDTRFGYAAEFCETVERICGKKPIHTIADAEPLGPKIALDALLLCPCTGNTLAKMANGITDTAVTMAAKAHLRSDRPLVIALASNDALSANLKNVAAMLARKSVYFVPMRQDDPVGKPHSLVADFSMVEETLRLALQGKQIPRLFV